MTLLTTLQLNTSAAGEEKSIEISASGSSSADIALPTRAEPISFGVAGSSNASIHPIGEGGFPFIFGPGEYTPGVLRERNALAGSSGDSTAVLSLVSESLIDVDGDGTSDTDTEPSRVRVLPGISASGTSMADVVVSGTVSLHMDAVGSSSATFMLEPDEPDETITVSGAGSSSASIGPVIAGGFPFIFGEYESPGVLRERAVEVVANGNSSATLGPLEKVRYAKLIAVSASGSSDASVAITRERDVDVHADGGSDVDIEISKRYAPPRRRPVATSSQRELVTTSSSSGLVTSSRLSTLGVSSVL